MRKTINPFVWYSMVFLFAVFVGCKKGSTDDDTATVYLRVMNGTDNDIPDNVPSGPISVKALPDKSSTNFDGVERVADFGTIEAGKTSAYKAVSNMFLIEVNGDSFGENGFGISAPPSTKWTMKIRSIQESEGGDYIYGWDLSADL